MPLLLLPLYHGSPPNWPLQSSLCEFRPVLYKSIKAYLTGHHCLETFTTQFLTRVQSWLDPSPHAFPVHPHPNAQTPSIGLHLITRGSLSREWRQSLGASLTASSPSSTATTDHSLISTIAGLIKTMWNCMGQLWLDHLITTPPIHLSPLSLCHHSATASA